MEEVALEVCLLTRAKAFLPRDQLHDYERYNRDDCLQDFMSSQISDLVLSEGQYAELEAVCFLSKIQRSVSGRV